MKERNKIMEDVVKIASYISQRYEHQYGTRIDEKLQAVPFSQTEEFQKALALVKTMTAKGGNPVPADEDGLEALVEAKYKL